MARCCVDGVDVRELDPDDLWSSIGLVPQRPYLFTGTVASNLRYGKADATDDELWQALEIAQARDFVEAMPDGLDAPIAQGGTNVSGGQRQRLAIARALVKKPEVYLFDDSFSALDLATDARLRAALRPETRDATVIIVAQRVSTIPRRRPDRRPRRGPGGRCRPARRPDGQLRDLSRDRPVPAERGGGGMSERGTTKAPAAPAVPVRPPGGGPRGPMGMMGGGVAKPMNFKSSSVRLLGRLRSDGPLAVLVIALGVISVVFSVIGPKVLGHATNLIFAGVVGKQLPAGASTADVVAGLRHTAGLDRRRRAGHEESRSGSGHRLLRARPCPS